MPTTFRFVCFIAMLSFLSGCAIDASAPVERFDPDPRYIFGPVTHEVVCRCTCRADNADRENPETHALPVTRNCDVLNGAQCELATSGALGQLENCFRKSVRVPD